MLNKKDEIIERLRTLSLSTDEAKLYMELLREPMTHLQLSQATGINRTKIYRLADQLEKRSLVTSRTDDRGSLLVATDPATLEIELITQEEKLKTQRSAYEQLLPILGGLQNEETDDIVVHTYNGAQGFKQMLWHELKTQGENMIFGSGTITDLVGNDRWAEKHRTLTVEAGYDIRELLNPGEKKFPFTLDESFMHRYRYRMLPKEMISMDNQIVVYNNTVAIYHWKQGKKVGIEVMNKNYANMMRQIFEHYWMLAGTLELNQPATA